jgi:hypothetical protein
MDQDLTVSDPITGHKEALQSVSSTRSESLSPPASISMSSHTSLHIFFLKSRKINYRSILVFSTAAAALLALWGTLCTLSVFYAIPNSPANGTIKIGEADKSNDTGRRPLIIKAC